MKITKNDVERFEAKVSVPNENGCMIWEAGLSTSGYGVFFLNGKQVMATHVAYNLAKGEIPEGLLVRHKCDVPKCVNPEHLEVGTQAQNIQDAVERGRWNREGENNGRSKLTCSDVKFIRRIDKPQKVIAKYYGVDRSTIGLIKRCERWKSCGTYCKE